MVCSKQQLVPTHKYCSLTYKFTNYKGRFIHALQAIPGPLQPFRRHLVILVTASTGIAWPRLPKQLETHRSICFQVRRWFYCCREDKNTEWMPRLLDETYGNSGIGQAMRGFFPQRIKKCGRSGDDCKRSKDPIGLHFSSLTSPCNVLHKCWQWE